MPIWNYAINRLMEEVQLTTAPPLFFEAHNRSNCAYCDEALRDIQRDSFPHAGSRDDYFRYLQKLESAQRSPQNIRSLTRLAHSSLIERIVRVCPTCGWWIAFEETLHRENTGIVVNAYGGVGGLVEFDVADVAAPIREVRSYLVAKYESRFDVGPQLFEETVASVFADIGYRTRVTAYSGDDGIDVVLDGPNDQRIGVQVKRYRNRISVEQLRALTGALVVNGMTSGVFVTTSDFTAGAQRTADMAAMYGYRIELYDAKRFYDALKIAQRARYKRGDKRNAPFSQPLPLMRSNFVRA